MKALGSLNWLNPREIWAGEATDFTPWLAENLDRLGEAIGIDMELVNQEQGVGDFSCDIVARDLGTGDIIVIENQLAGTDHDHLGKIITYAAGLDAKHVVWVSQSVRDEHRQAFEWMNQRSDSDTNFFAVIVEVIKVDDSRPAVNFKLVVTPNEWQKQKRRQREGAISERGLAYQSFFQNLLDTMREKHRFTNARVAQTNNWFSFSSGLSGVHYNCAFAGGTKIGVELYLDAGDSDLNKAMFDAAMEDGPEIERELGCTLHWERLDNRRASRIAVYKPGTVLQSAKELQEMSKWAENWLLSFNKVFGPRLRTYYEQATNQTG